MMKLSQRIPFIFTIHKKTKQKKKDRENNSKGFAYFYIMRLT